MTLTGDLIRRLDISNSVCEVAAQWSFSARVRMAELRRGALMSLARLSIMGHHLHMLSRLGHLAPARWAGWSAVQVGRYASNVELFQTTYYINGEGYIGRGETGAKNKVTKRRRGKERVEWEGARVP